jgi:hypothetical protein
MFLGISKEYERNEVENTKIIKNLPLAGMG